MDKIEKKIFDKYFDADYDKCRRKMCRYNRIKGFVTFIPKAIASTYLCARFPFLKFNTKSGFFQKTCWYWSLDQCLTDKNGDVHDCTGWRKAFGIQLCKELKDELKRDSLTENWVKSFKITDIKEKFGMLNISAESYPKGVHEIILKYEYISSRTCIKCGRPAKYRTTGWIEPYCEMCVNQMNISNNPPHEAYKDFDWYGYNW